MTTPGPVSLLARKNSNSTNNPIQRRKNTRRSPYVRILEATAQRKVTAAVTRKSKNKKVCLDGQIWARSTPSTVAMKYVICALGVGEERRTTNLKHILFSFFILHCCRGTTSRPCVHPTPTNNRPPWLLSWTWKCVHCQILPCARPTSTYPLNIFSSHFIFLSPPLPCRRPSKCGAMPNRPRLLLMHG
jgi:hypothetical protein